MPSHLTSFTLALILLGTSIAARAAEPEPLTFAGQPVTFAYWNWEKEAQESDRLGLSPERRSHHEAAGNDNVIGLFRQNIHFLANGDVEQKEIMVTHLLTQSAVRRYGTDSFWVDAFAEEVTLEQAYTLEPNGRKIWVDPTLLQLKPDADDDIFTDSFEIVIPYPGVKPGSSTVLATRKIYRAEKYLLPFATVLYAQVLIPIELFEVNITWDAAAEPPVWQTDYLDLLCQETSPRSVQCRAEHIEGYESDPDISYQDNLPSIVVGEATSWSALARQMRQIINSAYSKPGELDQALSEILEGATSDQERLSRIHSLVSQEIRYLGLEHGLGGIVPRDTSLTLTRRFGDCKDKATLFIDLARKAGFDAYAVLTSTNRSNVDKLLIPASVYFNHMVACVRVSDQSPKGYHEICLDLTDPYSSYDVLSQGAQDAIRLDLLQDTRQPDHLPSDPFAWRMTVLSDVTLNSDGSVDETQRLEYGGANAAWLRRRLQAKSSSERNEWLEEDFEDWHTKETKLVSFNYGGIDDATATAQIEFVTNLPQSFDPEFIEDYIDWSPKLNYEASWFKSENEAHDLNFAGFRYRGEVCYHLPDTHRLAHMGAEVDFQSDFGRFRRAYRIEGGVIVVVTELEMPRKVVKIEEIPRFNKFIDHVSDNQRILLNIEREL